MGGELEHLIWFSALCCPLKTSPEVEGARVDWLSWLFQVGKSLWCTGERKHSETFRKLLWDSVSSKSMDFTVPDGQLQIRLSGWDCPGGLVCWCWDFSVVVALVLRFLVMVLTQEEQNHFHTAEFTNFSASRRLQVFQ